MKVVEKIEEANNEDRTIFSFEFLPPKINPKENIEVSMNNLYHRIQQMAAHNPSFCDITWRAGSSSNLSLRIANHMQNTINVDTMMHLTCMNMPIENIDLALNSIREQGIQNVLALRGDPINKKDEDPVHAFNSALDLIKHIRSKHGEYFGIAVAGYPEGHPDVIEEGGGVVSDEAYDKELAYLKQKVDAGAEVIITQIFFDVKVFFKFVDKCGEIGITCPIVPGIMPINTYKGFIRMTDSLCKIKVPVAIREALQHINADDQAVRAYGIQLGTEMCRALMDSGVKTLHFYTMNNAESALAILNVKFSRSSLQIFKKRPDVYEHAFLKVKSP